MLEQMPRTCRLGAQLTRRQRALRPQVRTHASKAARDHAARAQLASMQVLKGQAHSLAQGLPA